MNDKLNKLIQAAPVVAPYPLQSALLGEIVVNGVKAQKQGFGHFFTFVDTAMSGIASTMTAPIWLIKDLATVGLSAPFACLPKSLLGKKIGAVGINARKLLMQGVFCAAIDLATPLAALGLGSYAATPVPSKINARLPPFASSTQALSGEANVLFERLADRIGGGDKAIDLLNWIRNNPNLPITLVEEFPELKSLAPFTPLAAAASSEALQVVCSEEQLGALAQGIKALSTASFVGLIVAAAKNSYPLCGRLSKVDSMLSFGAVALSAPAHMLKNIFNIVIATPFVLLSRTPRGKNFKCASSFVQKQEAEFGLNAKCMGVALASIFRPAYGSSWIFNQLSAIVPKSIMDLAQKLLIEKPDVDIQQVVALAMELKDLNSREAALAYMLPRVLHVMQTHPEVFTNMEELLAIFPALAEHVPAGVLERADVLVPLLARIADGNDEIIREGMELLTSGNNPAEGLRRMIEENPDLREQAINILVETPEVLADAVNLMATTPSLMGALPMPVQDIIPALMPMADQLTGIVREHPALIQQSLQLIAEGGSAAEVIAQFTTENSALRNEVINVITENPGLARHFSQVYREHQDILRTLPQELQNLFQ